MNSMATKTVRDLAVEIPGATRVFENLRIDYCCGGKRSLADACAAAWYFAGGRGEIAGDGQWFTRANRRAEIFSRRRWLN